MVEQGKVEGGRKGEGVILQVLCISMNDLTIQNQLENRDRRCGGGGKGEGWRKKGGGREEER